MTNSILLSKLEQLNQDNQEPSTAQQVINQAKPKRYKKAPRDIQIHVQTYQNIKDDLDRLTLIKKCSRNELINQILKEYIKKNLKTS